MRERLAAARTALHRAEAELASAYGRQADAAAEPGVDDAAHLTGGPRWEQALADAARRLAGAARTVAELAEAHRRAAAEHATALAVFRRPELWVPTRDENPADSVAVDELAAAATKTGPVGQADAELADGSFDVDEFFDAVEDVVEHHTAGTFPPRLAVLGPVLDELAAVHQAASGDELGPLLDVAGDLVSRFPSVALLAAAPVAIRRLATAMTGAPPDLPG